MEPRIQYAKTKDGVNIAFWALGEGKPLVILPPIATSHTQLEWQWPGCRLWYERLAQRRMVVRYDHRGTGLSDRGVGAVSLDAFVLDLEAVADRLALTQFVPLGFSQAGPVAIAYAARHAERVSRLILWCTFARTADVVASSPKLRAVRALQDQDWEVYAQTIAHVVFGWSTGAEARQFAQFLQESATMEDRRAALSAEDQFDVAALLPQVQAPTLVLHRRQIPYPDASLAKDLASGIPDARLALLEGDVAAPWVGDMEAVLAAIDDFLGQREEAPAPALAKEDVHTILFTDVEASTSLTDRLGDAKARDVLRTHEGIVRDALRSHGGSEVKTMGDGFMASFSSATKALECAIAVQRAFEEHNETAEEPIRVRVGLNAGEPIAEEEDLFGTAVIVAARIAAKADGGEILAANVVRELAAGKGFLFSDRGDTALRGFEDPVRLFDVRWRAERSP